MNTDINLTTFMPSTSVRIVLPELKILVMIFLLLVSSLGIVYVKDLNRRLFIINNKMQAQNEQFKTISNKLLLEQSAWAAQARIQVVAQQQLQMQIPLSADIKVIKV